MEVYTIQMAKWKQAKEHDIVLVDTTIKSGFKELAPIWELVRLIKDSNNDSFLSNQERYTLEYLSRLMDSVKNNPIFWAGLLDNESIALACYCKAGSFCHRLILKDFLSSLCRARGIPFTYMGEIT